MTKQSSYIPALKYKWLTRFYDYLIQKFLKERVWKSYFIESFTNKAPQEVLDIGCGTGTLSMMIKSQYPNTIITGLDGDSQILEIAERKMIESGTKIQFVNGLSYKIPFPDNHFDIVTSTLMIHHLSNEDKHRTFKEVYRVLKPGGEFNIADWGKPNNIATRLLFYSVQLLDGFATTRDNVKGLLPHYLTDDGFVKVQEMKKFNTIGGSISIYKSIKL